MSKAKERDLLTRYFLLSQNQHPGPSRILMGSLNARNCCPRVVSWPILLERIPECQINHHYFWVYALYADLLALATSLDDVFLCGSCKSSVLHLLLCREPETEIDWLSISSCCSGRGYGFPVSFSLLELHIQLKRSPERQRNVMGLQSFFCHVVGRHTWNTRSQKMKA